jgi:hypothetical protein
MKFGVSDAQTYHWLHAMNAMGTLEATLTADYPIAAAFSDNGDITYVAHNYSNAPITVTFSDGYTLLVPANQMATSKDANVSGTINSDFSQAFPNGSVNLTVTTVGSGITKVEFYDGTTLLGEAPTAPYKFKATNLALGKHGMYAKVFEGSQFNVTNIVTIQVGEQVPYSGTPIEIPGVIEPGLYDIFEGGIGQNITYVDVSQNNEGDFRTNEYVDAATDTNEGSFIGWISAGEWVEYTIDVQTAGNYDVSFRYASGNASGGGPFHFEVEGKKISSDISVSATSTENWSTWSTATASNIELNEGVQVLRLFFTNGEFNLGKLTFSYNSPLGYNPPVADAGDNVVVVLPASTTSLDGSLSTDADTPILDYTWEQIYGPSVISFSDNTVIQPTISNLEEGIYKCKLTVSDGSHESSSTVLVIVSTTGNTNPVTNITSPANNATFKQNTDILITASASDLDGTVSLVEFFDGATKIGEDSSSPFSYLWSGASLGNHELTTKATDNNGATSTSPIVNITVQQTKTCTETSSDAQQGSFSIGYKSTFETIGTDVIVTFELLDTDKSGVVAYLWQQTPFSESSMNQVSGNTFTKTLSGLSVGTTINYACKFAFAGGLAVTKYISYVVDTDCSSANDVQAPDNFTATLGNITSSSIELLLNATDDSGSVIYDITYGTNNTSTTGTSGSQKSFVIASLTPDTAYTFNVSARDVAGNTAPNNPLVIQATTLTSSNSNCSGSSTEALPGQGTFVIGYNYNFTTSGTDVTFTFELLDDKTDVIAYLWKESPFGETPMTNTSGKIFTKTITGQTPGATLSYACKFAFAGGLAVTKYFSYVVGDDCSLGINDFDLNPFIAYPNPTNNIWTVKTQNIKIASIEVFDILGKNVMNLKPETTEATIDATRLKSGIYFAKIKTANGLSSLKLVRQ